MTIHSFFISLPCFNLILQMSNKEKKHWLTDFINWYFSKQSLPYWVIATFDSFIVFISIILSYYASWKTDTFISNFGLLIPYSLVYTFVYVIFFRIFHTYSGILRYSSFVDLLQIGKACLGGFVVTAVSDWVGYHYHLILNGELHLGIKCVIAASALSTVLIVSVRVLVKLLYDIHFDTHNAQTCFIYGVKDAGIGIAKSIRSEKPTRFMLKGFVTDEKDMGKFIMMGKKVYPLDENVIPTMKKMRIKALIVSPMRSKAFRENEKMQEALIDAGIKIYRSESEMEYDPKQPIHLREISVEDLLPRGEINIDLQEIENMLKGTTILITGSAGSIGSEIVRQVASFSPKQLILIDQAETPEHDIRLMMKNDYPGISAETIVASITNKEHMQHIFEEYHPEYVFHAAAYKHVPMMEDNPGESIHNNVYGTKVIADLSVQYGVKKFVMVSTDKAVNPTNVMGCSKRLCEIYVQSLNNNQHTTQFVTTRFGNVLGSNGSVIPLFRKQLQQGGPITITHPDITRFFMLISEACKLVLEAGVLGKGGEIFVFDMGRSVKIADLAKRMIVLSGANNVKIEYTGLRAGEKLYEEVLNEKENTLPSVHEKIRVAQVREYDFEKVCKDYEELFSIATTFDNMEIVRKMKEIVPEYKSNNSVYSVLD